MLHLFCSTVSWGWHGLYHGNIIICSACKEGKNKGRGGGYLLYLYKYEHFDVDFGGRCDRNCQAYKEVVELMLSSQDRQQPHSGQGHASAGWWTNVCIALIRCKAGTIGMHHVALQNICS